jgi:hypothetical protein
MHPFDWHEFHGKARSLFVWLEQLGFGTSDRFRQHRANIVRMLEDKSLKERITIPEAQLMLWSIGESWEFVRLYPGCTTESCLD